MTQAGTISLTARIAARLGSCQPRVCHGRDLDVALILLCLVFAPSSIAYGALSGACPLRRSWRSSGWARCWSSSRAASTFPLPGGVSLAVVISTHVPGGNNAELLPAVLLALRLRPRGGVRERLAGRRPAPQRDRRDHRHERPALRRRLRGFGRRAADHDGAAGEIAGGETFGIANSVLFRARDPGRRHLRDEEDGRRPPVRGDRRQPAGRPRHRAADPPLPDDGLCARAAALLRRRHPDRRHHHPADGVPGRLAAAAIRGGGRAWRDVAARRAGLPRLDRDRGVLPQPAQPVRAVGGRALFGPDNHSGLCAWIWHRRVFAAVDGTEETDLTNQGGKE